jgi:hypothetical protein
MIVDVFLEILDAPEPGRQVVVIEPGLDDRGAATPVPRNAGIYPASGGAGNPAP